MAQAQKATQAETTPSKAAEEFRLFECTVKGKTYLHRTRTRHPVAAIVGVTPEGDVDFYRWTASEKLVKRGLKALDRSGHYAECLRVDVTEVTGKHFTVVKQGTHTQTSVVVSKAEAEAEAEARAEAKAKAPKKAKAQAPPKATGETKTFKTKREAFAARPEGMTKAQFQKAVVKLEDGWMIGS